MGKVFGVPVLSTTMNEFSSICLEKNEKKQGGFFCFVSAHGLAEAQKNSELLQVFQNATHCVPDGLPLVWVLKAKGEHSSQRICGPDFMNAFLKKTKNKSHLILGGFEELAKKIISLYELTDCSYYSPPFRSFSEKNAEEDWNAATQNGTKKYDFVWVCLGAPKQDFWCNHITTMDKSTLFFSVGAAIDFLSKTKSRAPVWMQKIGMEWFFRMISEPKRLTKRYAFTIKTLIENIKKI